MNGAEGSGGSDGAEGSDGADNSGSSDSSRGSDGAGAACLISVGTSGCFFSPVIIFFVLTLFAFPMQFGAQCPEILITFWVDEAQKLLLFLDLNTAT